MIHLAFRHDLLYAGNFQGAVDADRRAIETFGAAFAGSDKPFVIASGILGLAPGRIGTEQDGRDPGPATGGEAQTRQGNAQTTLALGSRGVRSTVLRLPPTVHGEGDNGFMTFVITTARAKGISGYLGDGSNRRPAVHRSDAARIFRLAPEKAPAGSVVHAIAEEGVPSGFLAGFLGADSPASSAGLIDVLDVGHYFTTPADS